MVCSLTKSFLIDFTIDQCKRHSIPTTEVILDEVFDYAGKKFRTERLPLPVNPNTTAPLLLVPKRWLRFSPWINYDDYFADACIKDGTIPRNRVAVLQFNRENYGMVQTLCSNRKNECNRTARTTRCLNRLRSHRRNENSKKSRNCQPEKTRTQTNVTKNVLLSYWHLFLISTTRLRRKNKNRTDSGVLIRDLILYNNRSFDFLRDIFDQYESRQLVFELKNVREIEREHVNQLNRYLKERIRQVWSFGNPKSAA